MVEAAFNNSQIRWIIGDSEERCPHVDNGKVVANTLTPELIEGGTRLLQELDDENIKVDGALWFFFDEDNSWKLMLALRSVEKHGPKAAYRKIQDALEKLKEPPLQISLNDVALVKPGAPLLGLLRRAIGRGQESAEFDSRTMLLTAV